MSSLSSSSLVPRTKQTLSAVSPSPRFSGWHRLPLELLTMIFELLFFSNSKRSLASCAGVCKVWSHSANETLWKRIDLDAFTVLAPLYRLDEPLWGQDYVTMTDDPTPSTWDDFVRLVKGSISVDLSTWRGWSYYNLDASLNDELTLYRPPEGLFPCMREFKTSITSFMPCLYPHSLDSLSLDFGLHSLDPFTLERSSRHLEYACHRLDQITRLDLRSARNLDDPQLETALLSCLRAWNKIQWIGCPLYFLRDVELEILGRHQDLKQICVDVEGASYGYLLHEERVSTHESDFANVDAGSFGRLRRLEFGTSSLPTLQRFLTPLTAALSCLSTLWVRVPSPHNCTPKQLRDTLTWLSLHTPRLRHLTLRLAASRGWDHQTVVPVATAWWEHLSPLTLLGSLEHLDLSYTLPFYILDAEIATLAQSLPNAVHIALNAVPVVVQPSSLTITSLAHFATYCPLLQHLELYINAEANISMGSMPIPIPRFASLKNLRLGHSSIVEAQLQNTAPWLTLRAILFRLLPPGVRIWTSTNDQKHDYVDAHSYISQGNFPFYLFRYTERWTYMSLSLRPIEDGQITGHQSTTPL